MKISVSITPQMKKKKSDIFTNTPFYQNTAEILTLNSCFAQVINIIQRYIYKQMDNTKTKQAAHILQYITHFHQHTWSIHNSYMSKMCIQNIANIFAGFLIRACWILREIREN